LPELILSVVVLFVVYFFIADHRLKKADRAEEARIRIQRNEQIRVSREEDRNEKERIEEKFKIVAEEAEAEKRLAVEQAKTKERLFNQRLSDLKSKLPFYISDRIPSAELADHDQKMWEDVVKLLEEESDKQATLYFVKIRSLLDDIEYYKIGITTSGVEAKFTKSTQVELLEIVCVFETEIWKAAYLKYHFLREFRLYDGLASSLGELRPNVAFSGYTQVLRSNSVNKITDFFSQLDLYNEPL